MVFRSKQGTYLMDVAAAYVWVFFLLIIILVSVYFLGDKYDSGELYPKTISCDSSEFYCSSLDLNLNKDTSIPISFKIENHDQNNILIKNITSLDSNYNFNYYIVTDKEKGYFNNKDYILRADSSAIINIIADDNFITPDKAFDINLIITYYNENSGSTYSKTMDVNIKGKLLSEDYYAHFSKENYLEINLTKYKDINSFTIGFDELYNQKEGLLLTGIKNNKPVFSIARFDDYYRLSLLNSNNTYDYIISSKHINRHIVFTYDNNSNTLYLYQNGLKKSDYVIPDLSFDNIIFGAYDYQKSANMYIDNIIIYDLFLDDEKISNINKKHIYMNHLLAYYPFKIMNKINTQNQTIKDYSFNNNDISDYKFELEKKP